MNNKNNIPLVFGLGALVGASLLVLSFGATGTSDAAMQREHQARDTPQNHLEHEQWRFEFPAAQAPTQNQKHVEPRKTIGRYVSFTPPPLPDFSGLSLARSKADRMILAAANDGLVTGQLELDETRRDPMTSLGLCTRWVVKCVDPNSRSLDDCTRSAPQCRAAKPWLENEQCCPKACFEQYAALRQTGRGSIEAFDHVYFGDASCFPGVQDLLAQP